MNPGAVYPYGKFAWGGTALGPAVNISCWPNTIGVGSVTCSSSFLRVSEASSLSTYIEANRRFMKTLSRNCTIV